MKKQNKWKQFSHICRSVGRQPVLGEFNWFMTGGLVQKQELRVFQKPLPETKDSPNASLMVALLDNRPKLDEQEMTCKNLHEKLSNLTNEQKIILLKRKRYELAYLANIINTLAFETDFIKSDIQASQSHTSLNLYPFTHYGSKSHSITKIYKKERVVEQKRKQFIESNESVLEQAMELCRKRSMKG